jgi:plasmid stabilization system protein ParE
MDRRLIWTERASSDIEAIVRYIARRDPKASGRIGLGIYERAQILLRHPEAGTVLDELRDGRWRKLIYRRWKIVYQVLDDVIVVGRVWPAAKGDADLTTPLE